MSLASSRSMGEIYEELLKLHDDYYCYRERVGFRKGKKVKKRLELFLINFSMLHLLQIKLFILNYFKSLLEIYSIKS